MFITGNGTRCHNAGRHTPAEGAVHLRMCHIHRAQYEGWVGTAGHHTAGRCLHIVTHARGPRHTWCPNAADADHPWCGRHRQVANRRARVAEVRDGVQEMPAADWIRLNRLPEDDLADAEWEEAFVEFQARQRAGEFAAGGILAGMLDAHRNVRRRREAGAVAAGGGAPVAPIPELGRLARDRQNVHDGQVNRLTNEGIERLCAVPVPAGQDTLRLITHAFTGFEDIPYDAAQAVLVDLVQWWSTAHCRTAPPMAPDRLYQRTLMGLVAYIGRVESVETRSELWRRVYQEACEAVGMCCDGHLARLVNVLVGFDDAFRPPVSQGELIQARIATIAGLADVSEEERVRQANAFFDEIALPAPERAPWLEALA